MLVILNTASGTLSSVENRQALRAACEGAGLDARFEEIDNPANIEAAVRSGIKSGCSTVVAAGGDGTINAVATLLLDTDTALGVIPGGTLNHFAKDLKIPLDFSGAAHVLKTGIRMRIDVAAVNGHYFLNNSGLGLYPEMVLKREEIQERGFRKTTALIIAAAYTLVRFSLLRVRLKVNGEAIDRATPFVFVGNNPYECEGVRFGTRSHLNTGQLCVWVARRTDRWVLLRAIVQMILAGLRGVRSLDVLNTCDATIDTRAASVPVSIDGEVVRMQPPLRYEIRPGALTVIVPAPEDAP